VGSAGDVHSLSGRKYRVLNKAKEV